MLNTLRSSIFAGIYIGVAGFGFLASGCQTPYGSLVGAVLFALGLMSIVGYKIKLYTGTAGFITKHEIGTLLLILLGNIAGCFSMSLLTKVSPMCNSLQLAAMSILETRLAAGTVNCGILAVGCGLLMTTAVTFARQNNYLPLLFAVPLFIVCGFPHCVADAFYYLTVPYCNWSVDMLGIYAATILGNAVGCNLYRIVLPKEYV